MRESITLMEDTIVKFKEFIAEVSNMLARWEERSQRVTRIENSGWKHRGKELPESNRKALISLKKTAADRFIRDESRLFDSKSVLAQMERRIEELKKASKDFTVYNTMNALQTSTEMAGTMGSEIESVLLESRTLAAKANAYIEIEAGKNAE